MRGRNVTTRAALAGCMRSALLLALVATASLVGCTGNPQQSTTPTPSTATPTVTPTPIITPATTPVTPTPTNGSGNATTALLYTALQSGPPGNNTTYSFRGPSSAASGWLSITLRNEGSEPHQLVILRVENGTYADVLGAMGGSQPANNSSMPAVTAVGGIAGVSPGGFATTAVNLDPGSYVLACFVPSPTGMPHAMGGMIAPLNVTARGGTTSPPVNDASLLMGDYAYRLDRNLTAGTHVVAIRNSGNHTHEAVFVKLADGKTARDFTGYFESPRNMTGSPPGTIIGGGAALDPGLAALEYAAIELTPGRYAILSFQQDAPNAPPDYARGLLLTFDVK